MKNQYKRRVAKWRYSIVYRNLIWDDWGIGRYEHKHAHYFRHIKTFNELRQNNNAIQDGYKVRGRRSPGTIPTCNDDLNISRNWKRSWKDFTKYRKQYLKNLD